VFHRVSAGGSGTAPASAALCGAFALATVVNLITVALAGTGVWLLVTGTWPQRILGAVELLIALALRPRPRRAPRHTLDRATAPTLYAVTGRVAAELGTRPPDLIAVDARYGSGSLTVGARRRRVLVLGLPLWETLTPDERLALLGHELARTAGGGGRGARWIDTALDSLTTWTDVLRPGPDLLAEASPALDDPVPGMAGTRRDSVAMNSMGAALARPLLDLMEHGARRLHRLLSRLNDGSAGPVEYRADASAARIASPASTRGLLHALLLRDTAVFALQRLARAGDGGGDAGTGLWEGLRDHMASVPDTERARRLRLSEVRGDAASDTSPPTHLRIRFVERLPRSEPTVEVTTGETGTIETELLPARTSIARELRDQA